MAFGLAPQHAPSAVAASGKQITLSERLDLFAKAYPGVVREITQTHVVLRDGSRLLINDGRKKTHQQKLVAPDIKDMLSQVYPTVACKPVDTPPERDHDPGRIRNGAFMRAAFGQSVGAVRSDLETVKWFGTTLRVTNRFGTADALRRVARDLTRLKDLDRRFVTRMGGTFNWRFIAGTKRLSVHSFAAAVDLNPKLSSYWRWSGGKPGNVPKYKNRVPRNIIEVFERHDFLWGGRWYHYDTMHFEFRPAVMAIARLAEARGCVKN